MSPLASPSAHPTRSRFTRFVSSVLLVTTTSLATACSSSSSGGAADNEPVVKGADIAKFFTAFQTHNQTASTAHQGELDTIKAATGGFTISLVTGKPTIEMSGPQATALGAAAGAHTQWFANADAMTKASSIGPLSQASVQVLSITDPGVATAGTGQVAEPLLPALILLGGLALTAWGAYKGAHNAVDTRAAPVHDKIASANASEMAVINQSMGLPASTPKDQALKTFDDLGMSDKLTKAKAVEQDLRVAETDGKPSVTSVDAVKINTSVANSSVQLGKTAVTTTVSVATAATGGQGYSQAMEAAGLSATQAAAADLGITAVSTAVDKPLQPLDILAAHCEIAVASDQKTTVTIPVPAKTMSVDDAHKILANPSASGSDTDAAVDTIATQIAKDNATGLGAMTNPDGSISVQVPAKVHLEQVDNPTNQFHFKVPDMGKATVLVMAEGKVPQVITGVDTSKSPSLGYVATDGTVWDPASDVSPYKLLVFAVPADPGPSESVDVTGQINPVKAGVRITLSIVGTDGYTNSVDSVTDAAGQGHLHIPGGAAAVVDTVTVKLPDYGITQVITYSF